MIKSKNRLALLAFFILAIFAFGLAVFKGYEARQAERSASIEEFQVSKGQSFNDVTKELRAKGIIQSETIFKIYGLLSGSFGDIKPGRYFLPKNIEISRLAGILTRGPEEVSVTVAPGMTLAEIDDELSSLNIIRPGELLNFNPDVLRENYPWLPTEKKTTIGGPLEGFLSPDTYNFFEGSDVKLVVITFLDNFQRHSGDLLYFESQGSILKIINLASILEKEVPDNSERRLVAGILNKRMSVGMPLQVDAVLIYENCEGRFLNCPALSQSDYKIDSAYNVYTRRGLPPGPISNPSVDAIKSALNPEKSSYWYYLSDPKTQKTIFSETLDEHNENRAKYLNI